MSLLCDSSYDSSVWIKWTLFRAICFPTIKLKSLYIMFTFFIIKAAGDNNNDTLCDSLENPIENFKFSLLYLFPYYLQIVQEISKTPRLLSDKVRLSNSNNFWVWYYNLNIVLYLGWCYNIYIKEWLKFFYLEWEILAWS